jgi:Arc/MetJ-type ribon-helix-helix transcriptional regulator
MRRGNTGVVIPPSLVAEIQAAADADRRTAADLVRDALERYLADWRNRAINPPEKPRLTPAQAAARLRESRKGNVLPDGVTIRDLMTHGRA